MKIHLVSYLALAGAILCEVTGSSFLMKTQQFTKLTPTMVMALCYLASFYLLSIALRSIPLGIAYAIWGGMGTVLIAIISVIFFRQALDTMSILGIAMIVGGVVVLNAFSSVSH
ncbi:DMT family transporter [Cohaesibacter haloalkalitolerans]|uniref:DMT family transporter n=1 Tax=Cohaesibacter haloalkalitolerans TaxID=1162980 RepID=UPI000E652F3B|nr:multidrug efflux SMR transporter [Cohaesibacter haloalkalitolerans]